MKSKQPSKVQDQEQSSTYTNHSMSMTNPTMKLVKATISVTPDSSIPSFKLIPVNNNSPYIEATYHPFYKILALISKNKKQEVVWLTRHDDNGDPVLRKSTKPHAETGSKFAQKQGTLERWYEHHLENFDDIVEFIHENTTNCDKFDFLSFMKDPATPDAIQTPEVIEGV